MQTSPLYIAAVTVCGFIVVLKSTEHKNPIICLCQLNRDRLLVKFPAVNSMSFWMPTQMLRILMPIKLDLFSRIWVLRMILLYMQMTLQKLSQQIYFFVQFEWEINNIITQPYITFLKQCCCSIHAYLYHLLTWSIIVWYVNKCLRKTDWYFKLFDI